MTAPGVARTKASTAKPHLFVNALRTTRSTLSCLMWGGSASPEDDGRRTAEGASISGGEAACHRVGDNASQLAPRYGAKTIEYPSRTPTGPLSFCPAPHRPRRGRTGRSRVFFLSWKLCSDRAVTESENVPGHHW